MSEPKFKMNNDPEWLMRMAKKEAECDSISVGGLFFELKQTPMKLTEDELERAMVNMLRVSGESPCPMCGEKNWRHPKAEDLFEIPEHLHDCFHVDCEGRWLHL